MKANFLQVLNHSTLNRKFLQLEKKNKLNYIKHSLHCLSYIEGEVSNETEIDIRATIFSDGNPENVEKRKVRLQIIYLNSFNLIFIDI